MFQSKFICHFIKESQFTDYTRGVVDSGVRPMSSISDSDDYDNCLTDHTLFITPQLRHPHDLHVLRLAQHSDA